MYAALYKAKIKQVIQFFFVRFRFCDRIIQISFPWRVAGLVIRQGFTVYSQILILPVNMVMKCMQKVFLKDLINGI